MFGPDLWCDRIGGLVTVRIRLDAGGGIIAQMAVDVDHAWRDELARAVDHPIAFGRQAGTNGDHLSVTQQHRAIVDPPARAIEYRGADQRGRLARIDRKSAV